MSTNVFHEVAGIFVRNPLGQILMFDRLKPPLGFTIPAGHIEPGEEPLSAALRELSEETSIETVELISLGSNMIWGDLCRRGTPNHHWHVFVVNVPPDTNVEICEEGTNPLWRSPEDWLHGGNLTLATRHTLNRHLDVLRR
ncbi:MAG: NUDIX hydrolase [Candidatus Saccharimonadaceae bacterium]